MTERMNPVKIEIFNAAALELFLENLVQLLFALDEPYRHLIRNRELIAIVAQGNGLTESRRALLTMIKISRIKMTESALHKGVYHPFKTIQIDGISFIAIKNGKSHRAESELLHR